MFFYIFWWSILFSPLDSFGLATVSFFDIVPNKDPTFTVSPSLTLIFSKIPDEGDGTSTFTLSVSNSTSGSSEDTFSP